MAFGVRDCARQPQLRLLTSHLLGKRNRCMNSQPGLTGERYLVDLVYQSLRRGEKQRINTVTQMHSHDNECLELLAVHVLSAAPDDLDDVVHHEQ